MVGESHELVNQIGLVQLRNQVAQVLVGGQAGAVRRLANLCKGGYIYPERLVYAFIQVTSAMGVMSTMSY